MSPPTKPPEERFLAFVRELNPETSPEDISDETWVSKSIESAIKDLPVVDFALFEKLRTVDEFVHFVRKETGIIDAIDDLANKMVLLAQSKKYKSIKNPSLARRLLNEGRKLESSKKLKTALTKLNEAILKAPFPDEECESDQLLAQILASRSSVLFEQSRFLESIHDGDAAIKFHFPTEGIAGILKRRIVCLKRMDREEDFQAELKSIQMLRALPTKDRLINDLIRTADKLIEENPNESVQEDQSQQKIVASFMLMDFSGCNYYLPSAVRNISKEFDGPKGNLLKSKRVLEIGDPVLREEAFVRSIFPGYHESRCNQCMCEIRQRFYPCSGCDVVRYCSTECQVTDWSGFHSYSCEYSMLFYGFSILRLVHDIFIAKRKQEFSSNKSWINSYISWLSSFIFSSIHTNDYKSFSGLASTFHSDPHVRMGFLFQSILITRLLSSINEQESSDIQISPLELNIFVLKTMLTIECCKVRLPDYDLNQIYEDDLGKEEDSVQASIDRMKKVVIKNYYGFGIFNTMALLNHSCDPNADYLTHGNQVYVFAKRPIKPNEEITISYGPNANEDPIEDRRKMLLNNFGFTCSCEKCLE